MSAPPVVEWELSGAEGQPILGVTDRCEGDARACVVLLHGHKGFSNYGCYPVLADRLRRALPVCVHRYNASHSGMTRDESTFERPDLFSLDTWNKQVVDLRAVVRAARSGALPGVSAGRPVVAIGHSRGGTACLLSAGREGKAEEKPDALVAMSAPSWGASDIPGKQKEIAETGRLSWPSARTGQDLFGAPAWLEEQLADPAGHDVLALCRRIACPALIVHGADDPTIPVRCAHEIAAAIPTSELAVIDGGDHVFNTAHPASVEAEPSPALRALIGNVTGFVAQVSEGAGR